MSSSCIFSLWFKFSTIYTILQSCFIHKCQLCRGYISIFIKSTYNYFFNNAFEHIAIKFIKDFILLQSFLKLFQTFFMSFTLSEVSCNFFLSS